MQKRRVIDHRRALAHEGGQLLWVPRQPGASAAPRPPLTADTKRAYYEASAGLQVWSLVWRGGQKPDRSGTPLNPQQGLCSPRPLSNTSSMAPRVERRPECDPSPLLDFTDAAWSRGRQIWTSRNMACRLPVLSPKSAADLGEMCNRHGMVPQPRAAAASGSTRRPNWFTLGYTYRT